MLTCHTPCIQLIVGCSCLPAFAGQIAGAGAGSRRRSWTFCRASSCSHLCHHRLWLRRCATAGSSCFHRSLNASTQGCGGKQGDAGHAAISSNCPIQSWQAGNISARAAAAPAATGGITQATACSSAVASCQGGFFCQGTICNRRRPCSHPLQASWQAGPCSCGAGQGAKQQAPGETSINVLGPCILHVAMGCQVFRLCTQIHKILPISIFAVGQAASRARFRF
jgi:hypothetical protein